MGLKLRAALARTASGLLKPLRWWNALTPAERVLYRALVLMSIGFGLVAAPLALIVPGVVLALVFFGFSFRRAS